MESHETKLKEYLPEFIYNIKDIGASAEAIDTQIKKAWDALNRAYANAFISTADEDGIKVFEKTLGITPDPGESLEDRREYALMMWNYSIPFTENYLKEYLEGMYGQNGYTYSKNAQKSEIYVTVDSYDENKTQRTKNVLRHMIPAHELLSFIASIPRNFSSVVSACAATFSEEEIASDICEGYQTERSIRQKDYISVINYNLKESEVKQ